MTTGRAVVRPRLAGGLVALATAVGAVIAAPATASASATGCVSGNHPSSCVSVNGASTYVENAAGGVYLEWQSTVVGHFHVFGPGIEVRTADAQYTGGFYDHERYGPPVSVRRDLPDGSRVCASFIESHQGDGTYITHSPACETIHR